MAKRKSSSGGSIILVLLVGAAALVASVPKEVWIGLGVLLFVTYVLYGIGKNKRSSEIARETATVERSGRAPRTPSFGRELEQTPNSPAAKAREFRIPAAPKDFGAGKWVAAGQSVEVAGLRLPGGLLYIGSSLPTPQVGNDPCLIDPSKSVASHGDFSQPQTNYWPSYGDITPSARRAYLNWLVDGRRNPEADLGYVFLFYYGLERRAIIDATESEDAQKDWPAIAQELRELLAVYGEKSGSFRRYAGDLLSLVQLANNPAKLYDRPLPFMPPGYELPLHLRLALGQASVDGAPVSAAVALAWARLAPEAYLRTPATRCADEFGKLFTEKYRQEFGTGMVLPRNRTKLKFVYRPASAGFRGYEEIKLTFGDIPDVSVLTAPVKKLQQIVEAATKALEPYSRYLGKNPDSKSALEGLLQLPATLWPQSAQTVLEGLKTRMGGGMIVLSFQELIENLDAKSALTKEKVFGLARALESMNIAMEPDVLAGAKVPKAEDKVVLFNVPPGEQLSRSTPAYQAAVLTLQLASSVATADGDFGVAELSHLRQQIQGWTHVTPSHQRRLLAHLRLLTTTPVSLTTLKKKLEPLSATAKETIASFMATVAQADGTVTPAEVKMLEKIYKALGVETKNVFSDVHTAAACNPKTAEQAGPKTGTGFKLDAARIAALQKDSEKVSRLLANIFTEEDLEAVVPVLESVVATEDVAKPGWLLGLDEAHASFARMLLSRPEWTRAELMDVTADLDLMLDGALEQLNEASFDKLDVAFTDGEDPVKVNNEVLEKIEA